MPGLKRATLRALLWIGLPLLPFWLGLGFIYEDGWSGVWNSGFAAAFPGSNPFAYYFLALTPYMVMAALFSTARRHNMMAAVHDLASGTRVVVRGKTAVRTGILFPEAPLQAGQGIGAVGPYRVLEQLGELEGPEWLLGYDLRLLRKVWIRKNAPGAEAYPMHLRNLGRAARLRWLTGRRTAQENWDAFEAPGGAALLTMIEKPQPWEIVRFWLWDIAREIEASRRDHTQPARLSLDRVWVNADGSAKLLDFPAPGIRGQCATALPGFVPAQENLFLCHMAASALEGRVAENFDVRKPVPLHARDFLKRLQSAPAPDQFLVLLAGLLRKPATVTRLRRAALVGGCIAFPLIVAFGTLLGKGFLDDIQTRYPDVMGLNQVLAHRSAIRMFGTASHTQGLSDREYAAFIASEYGSLITNRARWKSPIASSMIAGAKRKFAEESVQNPPEISPAETERARKMLEPMKRGMQDAQAMTVSPMFQAMIFQTTLLIYTGIPAILAAVIFRGGLVVRIGRVAHVKATGDPASRIRLLWRSIVCWSPAMLGMVLSATAFGMKTPALAVAGLLVLAAAGTCALLPRNRGLQDILSGTWPVAR